MYLYFRNFRMVLLIACAIFLIPGYRSSADTVAYYRVEEGSGSNLLDWVTNAYLGVHNATYSASVPVNPVPLNRLSNLWSLGVSGGQSATFSNQEFIFHNSYGDATLEFWINLPSQDHHSIFWTRNGSDDSNRYNIFTYPGGLFGFDYRDSNGDIHNLSRFYMVVDTWTHIAITRTVDSPSQHTYRSYEDGVLVATIVDSNPNLPTSTGWTISGRNGYSWTGMIDEIRFSNVALQPNQFLNATATLYSVDISPNVITGGNSATGTVTFSSPVGINTEVSLASSAPKIASVPTSVTVLSGQTSATFLITTSKVKADTPVTISASLNEVTLSEKLIVTPTSLTSITLNPTVVLSGKSVTGTVKLSKVAPADGWLVSLSSDNAVAPVPASVLVPAGANFARFTITTLYPDAVTIANISAMFGGTTKTAPLTVNPLTPVSLTLTPSTVYGGTSVSVKLTINALAPVGGKTVTLSSGNSAANCPASVVVPAGKSSVTFKIPTSNPAATTTGDISATLGGVTINAPLTVNHAIVTKLSVAFLPKASRYARGTVITLQATLLDETGKPVVGKTVTLKEFVSALGTRTVLGSLTTDANGQVQLTYTVPTDPAKDNVYIEAYFVGDVGYLPAPKASKRIPIGT